MVKRTSGAHTSADESKPLGAQIRGRRGLGGALVVGSATCALALFAPSAARAAECATPNDTTCEVTVVTTNTGTWNNAPNYPGDVNIVSGGVFINASGGTFNNAVYDGGTVTVQNGGAFDNQSGATFNNGDDGDARLFVQSGGIFNNAGAFTNGLVGEGAGEVYIESGGTFINTSSGGISQSSLSTITNSGTFTNLGGLTGGVFNNQAGGVFNHSAGNLIGFGGGMVVNNSGVFNIGYGNPSIATTTFYGTYTQTSTGELRIRADFATGTSDQLTVVGSADVNGMVVVTPQNLATANSLITTFPGIISATGGVTNNGLTVNDTAVVNYELLQPNANQIDLRATINFQGVTPGGLTPNQHNAGGGVNDALASGANLGFMPTLMGMTNNTELGHALDQLSPSGAGAGNAIALMSGTTFAEHLLSCRKVGENDANAVIREGQCMWARATVRQVSFDRSGSSYGASEDAPFFSAGAQFNLGGAWRLGGGLGYEKSHLETDVGSTTDTDRMHFGAALKYNPGPLLLAATVTGALGWSDNTRNIDFGGFTSRATSKYDSDLVSGRLTAAYLMPMQRFYLKPRVDVSYTHLSRDAYQEQAAGGAALAVASSSDGVWAASPSLEIGTQLGLSGGGVARPFIKAGVTVRDRDGFVTSASFLEAPDASPFTVMSRIDQTTADLTAGLDLITASETTLRVQYDGQFGSTIDQHIGSAKLSFKF